MLENQQDKVGMMSKKDYVLVKGPSVRIPYEDLQTMRCGTIINEKGPFSSILIVGSSINISLLRYDARPIFLIYVTPS